MNIIALTEYISFDKSKVGSFSKEEYAQMKKELIAEKERNPEIEDSDIAQLLKALKTHPEAFRAVLNHRALFNFLAHTDYPSEYFSDQTEVESEKAKLFLELFLNDQLTSFFSLNIEQNTFDEMVQLAEAKNYFPEELNLTIKRLALQKLDDAITALKPPYGNLSKVLYIQKPAFYSFLSQIKDEEIELKIQELQNAVNVFYKQDNTSELANKTFSAMHSYTAIDREFSLKIKGSKDISDANVGNYIRKRKNLTWVYVVVGAFVFIRLMIFFATFHKDDFNGSSNEDTTYDDEIEYTPEPAKIDKYYTDMKFTIDSFEVFLADYNRSEIKQLKQDVSLKTGDNPFETIYENPPTPDSSNFVTLTNNTAYDMVVLENTVLYDSIKIPRSAHFIKAGDKLEINFNSGYTSTIFNMYLGKKWSTFQTNSNHLFIRNHSVVEYRFAQLIPGAKDILTTDYRLINDADISYANGTLNIDSPGIAVNPLPKQ
ncbi:hypothetical protein [Flavobacterium sp.]